MTISQNEHILMEAEICEIESAEAEMNLYIEDDEEQLNVKLSRRSYDIIMAAICYIRKNKEMDGDLDD